ncbi:MAG: alpha/beta hydrolase [Rubrobacter sp.]|nr:alpha/beta hydrolase [Rubrobacter sp.]
MLYREFETQEELDAQYNLAAATPGSAVWVEFYEEQSRLVREELDCELGVSFGPTLDEHLDIFPAPGSSPGPVLVFIHGGYWHRFTSREFGLVARGPVSAGVTTVVTNYALCPKVTVEEILRQSRAAVAWVYRNAESFGGDRERIYVSGHSAGGHLTAMLLGTDWEGEYGLPAVTIRGGCAISGLFDLAPLRYTYMQPKVQLTPGQVARNSPILNLPPSASPLLVTYGGEETPELRRQSEDFLAAWTAAGLDGEYLPQPDKDHFSAIDGFLDRESPLLTGILRHLERCPAR